eukprot:656297-Pyramimonas_sp.AAC.2
MSLFCGLWFSSSNVERLVLDDDETRLSLIHENAKVIVDDIPRMHTRHTHVQFAELLTLGVPLKTIYGLYAA